MISFRKHGNSTKNRSCHKDVFLATFLYLCARGQARLQENAHGLETGVVRELSPGCLVKMTR